MLVVAALSDDAHPNDAGTGSPLVARDDYGAPSVFRPESLLREARRQKGLTPGAVPPVCILDPDGDIVRLIRTAHGAWRSRHWACYHTEMWEWRDGADHFGMVGGAIGGSFAVLVAEQLFASGCELLISITSAGQIAGSLEAPAYVLIDKAIRDEGTSHHYLAAAPLVAADPRLTDLAEAAVRAIDCRLVRGTSWTTDAPFRETAAAIAKRRRQGALTVEMEAASLLAFAEARDCAVLCVAHVTNQLGVVEGDFEKGHLEGAERSLDVALTIAGACGEAANRRRRTATGEAPDGSVQDGGRLRNSA